MSYILDDNEIKVAKAWLHDIFVWGGIYSPKRVIPIEKYRYMYGTHPSNFRTQPQADDDNSKTIKDSKEAADTICDFILHRKDVETQRFLALDKAVQYLSKASFIPGLKLTTGYVVRSPEQLCKFIAWFCEANNWVFDNKLTSVEEMKQIRDHTMIGKVLWDNFLFAQDRIPEANPARQKDLADKAAKAAATDYDEDDTEDTPADQGIAAAKADAVQQSQPVSKGAKLPDGTKPSNSKHTLYRSNCSGLVHPDKPKEQIGTNGKVFKIVGVGNTPTEITLNVKPQNASAPLNVYYGVGTGWNDCKLYFNDNVTADAFMGKALAAKPNEIKSLQVKAQSADKEGYVEVETEFGRAYIVATKLHEDIQEAAKIDEVEQKYVDMFPQVISNKELWEDETFDNFFKD